MQIICISMSFLLDGITWFWLSFTFRYGNATHHAFSDGSLSPTMAKFHGRCCLILVHPDINQVSRGTKNNNWSCNYPIILIMMIQTWIIPLLNRLMMLQFGCNCNLGTHHAIAPHLFRPAAARGPWWSKKLPSERRQRLLAAPTGSPRNVLRNSVPVISQ